MNEFVVSVALLVHCFALVSGEPDAKLSRNEEDWASLFKRIFYVVGSELEMSARQVQLSLTELAERLNSTVTSCTHSEAAEVRYWLSIANVNEENCSGAYDRSLLNRLETRALIALPERLGSDQRWNLKEYARNVRNQQLYFCLGQFGSDLSARIERMPAKSVNAISLLRGKSSYAIAFVLAKFYNRPKWPRDKAKDRSKFELIYRENVLNKCAEIRKPFEALHDFVDFVTSYDFYPKVSPAIAKWYELILLCDRLESERLLSEVKSNVSDAIRDYYKSSLKTVLQMQQAHNK